MIPLVYGPAMLYDLWMLKSILNAVYHLSIFVFVSSIGLFVEGI